MKFLVTKEHFLAALESCKNPLHIRPKVCLLAQAIRGEYPNVEVYTGTKAWAPGVGDLKHNAQKLTTWFDEIRPDKPFKDEPKWPVEVEVELSEESYVDKESDDYYKDDESDDD